MAYTAVSFNSAILQEFFDSEEDTAIDVFRDTVAAASAAFKAAGLADPLAMLKTLDARIAAFETVIIDEQPAAQDENKPYDRAALKREFIEEVFAIMYYVEEGLNSDNTINTNFGSVTNFATLEEYFNDPDLLGGLSPNYAFVAFYGQLIDKVFAEGDKLIQNPTDPDTGQSVAAWVVSSIAEVEIDGVIYDRVTAAPLYNSNDPDAEPVHQLYYVPKGVELSQVVKTPVKNGIGATVDYEFNFVPGVVFSNPQTGATQNVALLEVTITQTYSETGMSVTVTPGDTVTILAMRAMSPMEFLYYWNESRIRILKAQLGYKQAVVQEIQEDLRQANAALADLESVANIRNLNSEGEHTGDTSKETIRMNLFAATASTSEGRIFDGVDSTHNWGQWQENRINLKNYIDRKSAQSQDAMLDYQQLLNRYNSALEVMSKLQEKLDSMLKGQIRNL